MLLGVNIDHIAVLREARRIGDPDPIDALAVCKLAGADQITFHLREDRRHIQDHDAKLIVERSALPTNMECAMDEEMIEIACALRPHRVTLVPEKREEVTTEGGLHLTQKTKELKEAIRRLQKEQIEVSLFIDPTLEATETAANLGVEWVEFHTGNYANIEAVLHTNLPYTHHAIKELELPRKVLKQMLEDELRNLRLLSCHAKESGLKVAAGHGLNYRNVSPIVQIETIEELNIGQSIIARSLFSGLYDAIKEMKSLLRRNDYTL